MTTFDRLSALDAAFLDIETERAPMQVGWTMRFAGEAPSVEELRSHVEARLTSVPRLRRCIVEGSSPQLTPPGTYVVVEVVEATMATLRGRLLGVQQLP